jgi:hypothetical protein
MNLCVHFVFTRVQSHCAVNIGAVAERSYKAPCFSTANTGKINNLKVCYRIGHGSFTQNEHLTHH